MCTLSSLALAITGPCGVSTGNPMYTYMYVHVQLIFNVNLQCIVDTLHRNSVDERLFISFTKGARKVVMVGFFGPYHSPARRTLCPWNLRSRTLYHRYMYMHACVHWLSIRSVTVTHSLPTRLAIETHQMT